MMIDRRNLLRAAAMAATLPGVKLYAGTPGTPRLLVVFLRGAYDSASLLVPFASSLYREARPRIAVPNSGAGAGYRLDGNWAMHPALIPALGPFWRAKQLAFIPFAGSANASRSHFETQDYIELGMTASYRERSSGFLNRLAAEISGVQPMAFAKQLPIVFRGGLRVPNVELGGGGLSAATTANPREAMLRRMYAADQQLGQQVQQGFAVKSEVSAAMASEMVTSSRGGLSASSFEAVAQRIGRLMRDRVNLGFVDIGGWDTHANQPATLNTQFATLARGLAGFAASVGPAEWRNTTVVVLSEFGRTLRENGSRGTDHGRGSALWVLGGSVKGGRIVGEQVQVVASNLVQNRDLPVLNEYTDILAGLFQRLYGLDAKRIGRVFPGAKPRDFGLV